MDAVKIGYSTDPKARIVDLQVGAADKLECLLVMEGGRETERELHVKFKQLQTGSKNEWFYYKQPIIDYVNENLDKDRRYEFNLLEHDFEGNEQIKRLRNLNGYTLAELGEIMQRTAQSVKEIQDREKDGTLTIKFFNKIADILGYKFEYRFVKIPQKRE